MEAFDQEALKAFNEEARKAFNKSLVLHGMRIALYQLMIHVFLSCVLVPPSLC